MTLAQFTKQGVGLMALDALILKFVKIAHLKEVVLFQKLITNIK